MRKAFVILVFCSFGLIANYRLDGFQVSKIYGHLQDRPNWEIKGDRDPLTDKILDQKFYYLSRGHQCFVFESEDQKYVLKLINHDRFNLPQYLRIFTFFPFLKEFVDKRSQRLNPSFMSFRLAYEKLKEETGLIFLQLNKSNNFQKKIVLVDKTNVQHRVDLDEIEFMIQKKGEMIYPHLKKLGAKKDEAEIKEALRSFAIIIQKRCEKHIVDDDLDVQINYGFIRNKAILIDPGRLCIDDRLSDAEMRKKELLKSIKLFRYWLADTLPEYVIFFEHVLFNRDEEFLREAQ